MAGHPNREVLGKGNVLTDVVAEPLGTVGPQHEPQLERPEPPPERHLPVAVVDDGPGLRRLVAQVLGEDAQRADQRGTVRHPEAVAVEVGEQPLVRVHAEAVGPTRVRRQSSAAPGTRAPTRRGRRRRAARRRSAAHASAIRGADRWPSTRSSRRWPPRRTAPDPPPGPPPSPRAAPSGSTAKSSSTSMGRSWSGCSPAMRIAFSTELCAWVDVYARSRSNGPSPAARQRAASSAHRWRPRPTPRSLPRPRRPSGTAPGGPAARPSSRGRASPARCRRARSTTASPARPSPADTRSASTDGPDAPVGK